MTRGLWRRAAAFPFQQLLDGARDLRHTAITKPGEAGVPESTVPALAGHSSRAMMERYSHIRLQAKRDAVEALSITPRSRADVKEVPKSPHPSWCASP